MLHEQILGHNIFQDLDPEVPINIYIETLATKSNTLWYRNKKEVEYIILDAN